MVTYIDERAALSFGLPVEYSANVNSSPFGVLLIALLIATNGFFAASEVALLSVRQSRLREMAESGQAGAQAALNLLSNPSRLLSVTQVGVTLASLGLDRTRVRLGADPHIKAPLGIIEAEGDFGRFDFDILALASPTNPKTSALTGHSLVAAARAGMCFRALDILRAGG